MGSLSDAGCAVSQIGVESEVLLGKCGSTPMMTERESVPNEREFRGNTVVFENTNNR